MFLVFFRDTRMCPAIPTHQIRHEEKNLQKHIRIQLHLKKEKKEKRDIDQPNRPTPHVSTSRKPNCNCSSYCSKKFKIAHRIAKSYKENFVDAEKIHDYNFTQTFF